VGTVKTAGLLGYCKERGRFVAVLQRQSRTINRIPSKWRFHNHQSYAMPC